MDTAPAGRAVSRQITAACTQVAARRALQHRNVAAAQQLATQLSALAHPTQAVDQDIRCSLFSSGCCFALLPFSPSVVACCTSAAAL